MSVNFKTLPCWTVHSEDGLALVLPAPPAAPGGARVLTHDAVDEWRRNACRSSSCSSTSINILSPKLQSAASVKPRVSSSWPQIPPVAKWWGKVRVIRARPFETHQPYLKGWLCSVPSSSFHAALTVLQPNECCFKFSSKALENSVFVAKCFLGHSEVPLELFSIQRTRSFSYLVPASPLMMVPLMIFQLMMIHKHTHTAICLLSVLFHKWHEEPYSTLL